MKISFVLNGKPVSLDVEPSLLLCDLLRETLTLTGTHVGCDTSQCGACVVDVDDCSVKSCTLLAAAVDGTRVTTVEGLATAPALHPMQQAFHENHGLQCGFCTPGMLMSSIDFASAPSQSDRDGRASLARGQSVPLHGIPEHRHVRAAWHGGDACRKGV